MIFSLDNWKVIFSWSKERSAPGHLGLNLKQAAMRKGEKTTGICVQIALRDAQMSLAIEEGKMNSLRYMKKMTPGLASE